jgi:NarL family two-component system sensor histidine kinase LiaS
MSSKLCVPVSRCSDWEYNAMMEKKVVLHIRDPFLLDASTYVSTAVMALLGVSGLPSLTLQVIALLLCLAFALVYRFVFRTGYYERNPVLYFGTQVVVLVMLLLLKSEANDAYNFLLYILTVHTAVVLHLRTAIAWTTLYFTIAAAAVLISRGSNGLYAIFFYLAAFIVCFIFGYVVQQTEVTSERNQRLVEELQATQRKLQDLAVIEERNRLARDLHDSVKQQVFAISMQLSAARAFLKEDDQAYASVAQAEKLAQQAGAELTTLIHQLRPPLLENKSLAEAIKGHINDWTQQNNIETETDIDEVSVSHDSEQALFRVLQEALANVSRHSQANKVWVKLKSENDHVALTIEDDGIGYDRERIIKGVGLDSMKERLAAVNGRLAISGRQSQGTSVAALVRRLQ